MKITEWCPHCEDEVELNDNFCVQICPKCGHPILPCSICEHTNDKGCHTKCDTCPLDYLNGAQICSANVYYENIRVIDDKGCEYFLNLECLTRILSQLNFQIERKRKRIWLTPIENALPNNLTDDETEALKKILDQFEYATVLDTAVNKISGGFANAEFADVDNDWVYITLKWGVQNDVDNDVHEEDWKLDRKILLRSDMTIKEKVVEIIDCN
jgi:predicted RNA-binding Zn-ribbon protein involved in translation (DUF1610 family)